MVPNPAIRRRKPSLADSSAMEVGSRRRWLLLPVILVLLVFPLEIFADDWAPNPMAFLRSDSRQVTILGPPDGEGPMEIRQFELRADDLLHRYESPEGKLTAFAFDPASRHFLFTGNTEGEIFVWPTGTSSPTDVFIAHRGSVRALSISPAGGVMVTGGQDGRALVVNTRPRQVIHELHGHGGPVTSAAWLVPRRVVTGCEDGILRVFDPVSGALLFASRQGAPIRKVIADYGPWQLAQTGGRYAVSVTEDGTADLWDLLSMTKLKKISSPAGNITGARFMRRHHFIEDLQETVFEPLKFVTWTDTGVIESWGMPSGARVERLLIVEEGVVDIQRNMDGSEFFVLKKNGDGMLVNTSRKTVTSTVRFGR